MSKDPYHTGLSAKFSFLHINITWYVSDKAVLDNQNYYAKLH